MKRILISEEERSRILGMHQEKGYKPLMEQGTPTQSKTATVSGSGGGMGIKDQKLMYDGKQINLPGLETKEDVDKFVIKHSNWSEYLRSYLMTNKLIDQATWDALVQQNSNIDKNAIANSEKAQASRVYNPQTGGYKEIEDKDTYGGYMVNSTLFSLYNTLSTMLLNLAYSGVDLKGQQPTKAAIIAATPNPQVYLNGIGGDATKYFKALQPQYQRWLKPVMNTMINTTLKLS